MPPPGRLPIWMTVASVGLGLWLFVRPARTAGTNEARPAPSLPDGRDRWVNGSAAWPTLRGKVVLLHVWTFGCINCVRTLPWYRDVQARYSARGLRTVGVHTPEFDHERDRRSVERHVREHRLDWPHLLDVDSAYWRALGNRYWPATYLVDRCGRIRSLQVGEVHAGQDTGRRLEAQVESLLSETDCQR